MYRPIVSKLLQVMNYKLRQSKNLRKKKVEVYYNTIYEHMACTLSGLMRASNFMNLKKKTSKNKNKVKSSEK